MPQTPNSASAPYCSARQFLTCYSPAWVRDMLRATAAGPPPSYLAMCDPNNPAGARLLEHRSIAAGEIESACTVATRYTPADLNALTGMSQQLLVKLNAARAGWSLAQFLKPITARPDDVPFAKESWELLEMLKDGVRIFGFYESEAAGLPTVNPAQPSQLITPNVVSYANRLFPLAGVGRNGPWVNRNSANSGGAS